MLKKKIAILLSVSLLCTSLTACGSKASSGNDGNSSNSDDTEYAQDSNPNTTDKGDTNHKVSEINDVNKYIKDSIGKFEKDFSHLNMKKTENGQILMMEDTTVKEMGVEYNNYLAAYSVPNFEDMVVNNVFAASLDVSASKEFTADEPLIQAIFKGLNTIGVNPFTEAEGLANELTNAIIALNNMEFYEIAMDSNLFIGAEERGSNRSILIGAKESTPIAASVAKEVKNFDSYDEYESMILSLNENYKSVLATTTGVSEEKVLQSTPDPNDSEIYFDDTNKLMVGFSRTIPDDFVTEVNVSITNLEDKREAVLDSVIKFIEDNFQIHMDYTGKDLIINAKSYQEGSYYINSLYSPLYSTYQENFFDVVCPNAIDPFYQSIDWSDTYLKSTRIYASESDIFEFRFKIKVNVEGKERR